MTAAALVTGIAAMAPNGLGTEAFWAATLAGRSGIGRITRFDPEQYPARLAGEVPGFHAEEHLPGRLLPQTDHMTRMALVAADWATADAGLDLAAMSEFDMGVVTASSSGGFEFGQRELEKLWRHGPRHVSAYQSFAWFYAVNTGQIAIRNGIRGPCGVLVSDQAGGLDTVGQARRQIRKGSALMVSGGIDSGLCPWGWVAQLASGRLSESDDPARAYLPFDASANGYVPGEGGAILIVENAESDRARPDSGGYGEIAGYAATFDPRPGSGGEPGLRRAMELALADAHMSPGDVDVVFADAAGMRERDREEAEALVALFGPHGVPVAAVKTMTGRLYSGGGPLDVVAGLLAIQDGVIPPAVNTVVADEYELDLVVGAPRRASVRTVLVVARGYGGFNSALVLRATDGKREET